MQKKKQEALDRSLDWIRVNPNAMNLDVPPELVAEWVYEDDEAEPKPSGFYFAVFTFGFLQRDLFTSSLPLTQPRTVPVSHVIECFGIWQMKLGLAELHRKTNLEFGPMSLFAFPDDEKITYRPRAEAFGRKDVG
jgi:hypothetical protein